MKRFYFDRTKCTGCGSCVVSCLDEYGLSPRGAVRRLSRREFYESDGLRVTFDSSACRHCANAPCLPACPQGCFYRDEQTGLVLLHSACCVGCGRCVRACPFGAVFLGQNRRAVKCNGCVERVRAGRPPKCVSSCPTGALSFRERADGESHTGTENRLDGAQHE